MQELVDDEASQEEISAKQMEIDAKEAEIEDLMEDIEEKQEEVSELSEDRLNQPTTPPGPITDELDESSAVDNPDVYPYLIVGSEWPKSFTYFALGWRNLRDPIVTTEFERPYPVGMIYAAARLMNPTAADLWTPDWRARLVRVNPDDLTNPVGNIPSDCGSGSSTSGQGELAGGGISNPPDGGQQQGWLNQFVGELSKH
jgi:hypothetical protein